MPSPNSTEAKTPVYVPYATMISALDTLKNHGIPTSGRIDKTIWESQSGSVRGQLLLAFKFLGLIDDQNQVLPSLPPLAAASIEGRKPLLKAIIEDKYRDIIALGLNTISQGQLTEAFAKFGINGSTLKAAIRFFVKACSELDIAISKRFSEKTRASGPRKKRALGGKKPEAAAMAPPVTEHTKASTWEAQLLGKFPSFDPSWPDALKTKWFEGFERLMGAKPE